MKLKNLLLFLFFTASIYSQSDNLIVEHITREQGLPNSPITWTVQDSEGYIWFCTENGVVRYDGYTFQHYSNNPNDTTSFTNANAISSYLDKQGTLWFGTRHGLEKFNRSTNSFTNYLPDHSKKIQVIANFVCYMTEDTKGNFWITTGKGVYQFNRVSGKFLHIEYDSLYISGVPYIDKEGSFWEGTIKGLDKFNYKTGKFNHYWHNPENEEASFATNSKYYIKAICEDKDGILWLGTTNGLIEFNKKSNKFTQYLLSSSLHNEFGINRINTICLDSSNCLWLGTEKGVFSFNTKLKKFTPRFNNKASGINVGNKNIISLYMDHSGVLWVSTWTDGIYKVILKNLPFKRYFAGTIIHQVFKGNNGILFINKGNNAYIKFDTKTERITPANLTKAYLVRSPSDSILLGKQRSKYLTKIENGKINVNELINELTTNYLDNTGMWYGIMNGGLYFLDFKTNETKEIVRTQAFINNIFKDSHGLIWAASDMGKLICYNPEDKSVTEFISDIKNPSSISGREIFEIYEDRENRLWFATNGGLNRFIPSTKAFVHFTEKDGLSENVVSDILEDNHGNLWLGTNKGISKFNPEINQFKNFDVLHGLSSNHWNSNLAVKMRNGEMFFGRSYGLIRFHPDSIKENTYIPPVVITSCKLFDKDIPFTKDIKLTYDKNFLSFEFAALNYFNSQRNQYAYKMEGVDKDWIYSGTRRYASYPNLSPGEYTFKVKGSNNDGVWNESGTSLSIIITPPWWGTWWFKLSSILILFVTVGGTIRFVEMKKIKRKIELLEQERALERERIRISRDMHDEIGSNLSEIAILSELAKKSPDEAERHVREISELTAEVIDSVSEIVWAMNPQNDKLDNLIAHIRRYAVKYLGLADINCRFASPEDITSYPLSTEFRRNIYLVVKEILHNIVKHSCASEVLFAVNFIGNKVEMIIKDNGKGFSTEKSQAFGNGLSNMRKRIEDIGGFISIQSVSNKGTQISLSAKIDL